MNASTTAIASLRNEVLRSKGKANQASATQRRAERDAKVTELLPFVECIANRISRDIRGKVELEELIAWGVTGLLESIDRYDPDHNASLKTFAYYRIRGAMLDNIGKVAPLTRSGYRRAGAAGDFHAIYRVAMEASSILDSDSLSPEDSVMREQNYQVLSRAMKCLKKEQRHLVQEHYFGGRTLKDAGNDIGRSKSWACRSHAAALTVLREAIEGSEMRA